MQTLDRFLIECNLTLSELSALPAIIRYKERLAQVKQDILDYGFSEIKDGVYLTPKASLIEEHEDCDDCDEAKDVDFSSHDFWITTDNEVTPLGFDSIDWALVIGLSSGEESLKELN